MSGRPETIASRETKRGLEALCVKESDWSLWMLYYPPRGYSYEVSVKKALDFIKKCKLPKEKEEKAIARTLEVFRNYLELANIENQKGEKENEENDRRD